MCQSCSLKQYRDKDIKYHPSINNLKPNVNEYFTSKTEFKSRPKTQTLFKSTLQQTLSLQFYPINIYNISDIY